MAADTAAQPLTTGDAGGSAEQRLTNLLFLLLSSGYLAYLLLLGPVIVAQAGITAPWWSVLGPIVVFGPPVVMGIAGSLSRPQIARRAAAASALSCVVAAVTWPLAWNGTTTGITDVWFGPVPGLAGLCAAIVWRTRWALALLAAAVIPTQMINQAVRDPSINGPLLPDVIFAYSFSLLFVAAACMTMRTGRMLDTTRASAHAAAATAAATTARAVQRNRYNALLHDWVMSALLAAARQSDTAEVRKQAQVTLTKLDELYADKTDVYDTARLLAYVRTAVAAIDDTLLIEAHVASDAQPEYPSDAVQAIGEAVAEAVRNSVLHAGPSARRRVEVTVERGRFAAVVTDNGHGFDVTAIPPHRLGVAVSIVGRVRALPGGSADVRSRAGTGTTVTVSWQSAS